MKKLLVEIIVISILLLSNVSHAYTIVSQGLSAASYTASSSWNNLTPNLAFDSNWDNTWNSGKKPGIEKHWSDEQYAWVYSDPVYPWIEVDLGFQREISQIVLGVEQLPPCYTEHVILSSLSHIGDDIAAASTVALLKENTFDDQRLLVNFPIAVTARCIQVRSLYSLSWIAWNEIQIMTDDEELPPQTAATPAPEPSTALLMVAGAAGALGIGRLRKRRSR